MHRSIIMPTRQLHAVVGWALLPRCRGGAALCPKCCGALTLLTRRMPLLAAPGGAEDAKAFGLRWSFARHLDAQARLNLLERRRAQLLNQMDEVEPAPELDRYARSVVDHAADGVARDIHWLDELIAAERDALSNKADTAAGTSAARRASA